MKPFNLEEYLANPSKEVVTKDRRKVVIKCTDVRNKNYPIVALVEKHNLPEDYVFTYTRDGRRFVSQESDDDLFFTPEKHEGWINIFKGEDFYHTFIYNSKEDAEKQGETFYNYVTTIKIEWEE